MSYWNWGWVHTALFLYKNPDKNIRLCAFTLLTATKEKICVAVVLILSQCYGQDKYLFLCLHSDILYSKKSFVFLNIHFEGRFLDLRFCAFLCGIVWTISRKRRFISAVFLYSLLRTIWKKANYKNDTAGSMLCHNNPAAYTYKDSRTKQCERDIYVINTMAKDNRKRG